MLYRDRYRVESIRLKKWDYSLPGYYYITICVKDRKHSRSHGRREAARGRARDRCAWTGEAGHASAPLSHW